MAIGRPDLVYRAGINDAEFDRGLKRMEARSAESFGRFGRLVDAKTANVRKFSSALSGSVGALTGMLGAATAVLGVMRLVASAGDANLRTQKASAEAMERQNKSAREGLQLAARLRTQVATAAGRVSLSDQAVAAAGLPFDQRIADLQERQRSIEAAPREFLSSAPWTQRLNGFALQRKGVLQRNAKNQVDQIRDEFLRLEAARQEAERRARQGALVDRFAQTYHARASALHAEGDTFGANRAQLEVERSRRLFSASGSPFGDVLKSYIDREFTARFASIDRAESDQRFGRLQTAATERAATLADAGSPYRSARLLEGVRHDQARRTIEAERSADGQLADQRLANEAKRHRIRLRNIDEEERAARRAEAAIASERRLGGRDLRAELLRVRGDDIGARRLEIETQRRRRIGGLFGQGLSADEFANRVGTINAIADARTARLGAGDGFGAQQGISSTGAGRSGLAVAIGSASRGPVVRATEQVKESVDRQTSVMESLINRVIDAVGSVGFLA